MLRELTALSAAADDLGSNELNFMNSTRGLHTPNLDQLAFGGVTLRNCESQASLTRCPAPRCATASAQSARAADYVQPICSPTRSALMTGRYTIRLGTQSNVLVAPVPWGVALTE